MRSQPAPHWHGLLRLSCLLSEIIIRNQLFSPEKEWKNQQLLPFLRKCFLLYFLTHRFICFPRITTAQTRRSRWPVLPQEHKEQLKERYLFFPGGFVLGALKTASQQPSVSVWRNSQECPLFWESPTQACFSFMYGDPICAFLQCVLKAFCVCKLKFSSRSHDCSMKQEKQGHTKLTAFPYISRRWKVAKQMRTTLCGRCSTFSGDVHRSLGRGMTDVSFVHPRRGAPLMSEQRCPPSTAPIDGTLVNLPRGPA